MVQQLAVVMHYSEKNTKAEGLTRLDEWGNTVNTGFYAVARTEGEILNFCQQ